jgi:hypothetical protein
MGDVYNIYLVNVQMPDGRIALDGSSQQAVMFGISNFFIPVCAGAKPKFDGAQCWWVTCPMLKTKNVMPYELVVYFLPDKSDTLLSTLDKVLSDTDLTGGTRWPPTQSPTGSEVYCQGLDSDFIARTAIHEMMHNKLHRGDSLHDVKGVGIGQRVPTKTATTVDINLMANALRTPRPQWMDLCIRINDPSRGIF